jgi:hypothetical protein
MLRLIPMLAFAVGIAISTSGAQPQKSESGQDKNLDIRSSVGDLHMGNDADAKKAGLPLYPGARLRRDDDNNNAFNLGVFTEAFGVKLVIAKYDSDDPPDNIISFYRERLKRYGKVLECHTREHADDSHPDLNDDEHSKDLKCEGDNTGPVTELKVGTEDNQHVVAVESKGGRKGSTFALVYMHARGKQGDI